MLLRHMGGFRNNPALTIALALAAGVLAQSLARHLRVPGIVLLLILGVVLGPDLAHVVDPASLGPALRYVVGFAVAVILFEGGMNLNLARLRQEQRVLQLLITVGGVVTGVVSALIVRLLLDWPWHLSGLFGSLVIVTGPTVVTPLVRRLRVERTVATLLEAEGVLIDGVGAMIAVVAIEVVIAPDAGVAVGVADVGAHLGVGAAVGTVGGLLLGWGLTRRGVVPEGIENVLVLSLVLALFQTSNALLPDTGIVAVIVAGILLGNSRFAVRNELLQFKEQLTVMLIGMLFILLAADVRLADVEALGARGLVVVLALVALVRPVAVATATVGSKLSIQQRLFVAWMAPRGIVAAAVASLFAAKLRLYSIPGGSELRALVFLVIAVTVPLYGLTAGPLAAWLGLLSRPKGWVLLGAGELCRALATVMRQDGEDVVCIDSNPEVCRQVRASGITALCANALEEDTLERARIEARLGAIASTPNEHVNLLFAHRVKRAGQLQTVLVALRGGSQSVTPAMLHADRIGVLFARPLHVDVWSVRLRRRLAHVERRRVSRPSKQLEAELRDETKTPSVVAMARHRGKRVAPYHAGLGLGSDDEVSFVVHNEQVTAAHGWFDRHGLVLVSQTPAEDLAC
jgi:NhaP-type Na+/H+ or K+/H+ antiporter/Trk K+ transport system NAD-binding subunit